MSLQDVKNLNDISNVSLLITGFISIGFATNFLWSYVYLRKLYKLQLGILLFVNGINVSISYFASLPLSPKLFYILSITYNWTQVFSILLYQWIQCELLKLVCVASTFWTIWKVQIFKYFSIIIAFIGFLGSLFLDITYHLGDGSFWDTWKDIASTIVIAIIQAFALAQGIYMTFLIKSICYVKDEKSKTNYNKYLKQSYILLGLFIFFNIISTVGYIVGVLVRGLSPTNDLYYAMVNFAVALYSFQMVSMCFLFESIKSMKFGSDADRRKISNDKTHR
ncbi:hypothetical protein BC833DRAFT_567784 [Globomyces pollinis-pini]|nr:hypothetical protein BC833DRAFT_567784 [Globomyces pollinis-pini]